MYQTIPFCTEWRASERTVELAGKMQPFRIYRISNAIRNQEAAHREMVAQAVARAHEVLGASRPDTFAGRKTHEAFPKGQADEDE
jgi:hypothetical protein